ncbi:tubulin-specific chaperone E isoform X2 [Denticeps clupeoides]|uniref:Tubulin-specific chaperone E n=1 Tax=Denticeps clupeoides TaxID=299321 RepID=A0AAY4EMW7_9TELE|nr:tubulin-specific chaperone E isoform X2 [Denticeps clupeoides]XP_028829442.1 tubulin-specific chaperone E isoform X2 [Denticeps clupeoides]
MQLQETAMAEGVPADAVGRRVQCDGERATVRYVGEVPPTQGPWLGVEWDEPGRGKHDGSHGGVQYFTCRHPTSGSFVRPQKVSFGVDYLTAVMKRYQGDLEEVMNEEITISRKTIEWKGVGKVLQKQRAEKLTVVSLEHCEVCGAGADHEIQKATPHVIHLDLTGNLLSSWVTVAAITEQLEELKHLLLCYNRLSPPPEPLSLTHAFTNLCILSLKSCALTWPQVLQCAPMWPHLEELYLDSNNISDLHRPDNVLQSLTILHLSNNPLDSESLVQIAELSRLEELNLASTGLSTIQFSDVPPGSKTAMFPSLRNLSIADNKVSEWWVINELDKLKSLVRLSCQRNPVMEWGNNPATAIQFLIARVAQLKFLCSCEIQPEERRGAELDYCKMFAAEWLENGGQRDLEKSHPSAEFTTQHPRYETLIQKYGAPEDGELKKQKPFALKNQLLTLTFVCPDEEDRQPVEKKLPGSMIVQKVKGLLYRLLKLPASELRLSYVSSKMEGKEIVINNDLKPLDFFSIEDGDQVLVRWTC